METVKFLGTSGGKDKKNKTDDPNEVLIIGQEYTLLDTEIVNSYYVRFILKEFPDLKFNSSCFSMRKL